MYVAQYQTQACSSSSSHSHFSKKEKPRTSSGHQGTITGAQERVKNWCRGWEERPLYCVDVSEVVRVSAAGICNISFKKNDVM